MAPSRAVNGKCHILRCDGPCIVMTLVADKRRSLLIAGDDDEVYDKNKKSQRYAEDKIAAFNCTQW